MPQYVDYSKYTLAFSDEFNGFRQYDGAGGWKTEYLWGARTIPNNGEAQIYMDPLYAGTSGAPLGVNPFHVTNGVLSITAQPTDPAVKPYVGGAEYTSGLITTEKTYTPTYGYFEMSANLPAGKGLWPAFWLLPVTGQWPPEIDIMETFGDKPTEVLQSTHGSVSGTTLYTGINSAVGFHTYGLEWSPTTIIWYVDGVATKSVANFVHEPMYLLANLAVGGTWAGYPDATTPFPAEMRIDYIRGYSLATQPAASQPPLPAATPSAAPTNSVTGTARDNTLLGTAANDLMNGKGGGDLMQGGRGDDTYLVENIGDRVVERVGEGVDTVESRLSAYTLGADIENLTQTRNINATLTGNALANIIKGGSGHDVLNGGAGHDLLYGGGGDDRFFVRKGEGYDVISDFLAGGFADKVVLAGYDLQSFSDLQAHLQQKGNDVVLGFGNGEQLTFTGTAVWQFTADDFLFAA